MNKRLRKICVGSMVVWGLLMPQAHAAGQYTGKITWVLRTTGLGGGVLISNCPMSSSRTPDSGPSFCIPSYSCSHANAFFIGRSDPTYATVLSMALTSSTVGSQVYIGGDGACVGGYEGIAEFVLVN